MLTICQRIAIVMLLKCFCGLAIYVNYHVEAAEYNDQLDWSRMAWQ